MLQKFWIPIILCVIVILVGCDEGKQMMKPALTPEPIAEPTIERIPEQGSYPEITFENVLDLAPGRYRLRPTDSHEGSGDEGVIYSIGWGSIGEDRNLREGFTEGDPKIRDWVSIGNAGRVPASLSS